MCKIVGAFFFVIVTVVSGLPARDELMFDLGDDTAVVESTVRETRAAVPEHIEDLLEPGVKEAFLHSYGDKESDDGDVQGYHKTSQDKGSDGYKHFDSYHKKDGDKYGYEKHSQYGKKNKAEAGSGGKSQKQTAADDGSYEDDDKSETKQAYKVVEDVNEDKKGQRSAVEDYDGDSGYYADSGDSEGYTDAESENYEAAAEGEEEEGESDGGGDESAAVEADDDGENFEEAEYDDGEAESGQYNSEGGDNENYDAGAEYDDGESAQAYSELDGDEDY